MSAVLVLDPGCGFADLGRRLDARGWRVVDTAEQPLLPGEPEHATLELATGERLTYTFNPVCSLRVLDARPPLDADSLALLPIAGNESITAWLSASDERTLLRGVLAARVLSLTQLSPRLQALRSHASKAVSQAAAAADEQLAQVLAPAAQQLALASVDMIAEQLRPLLLALAQDPDGSIVASLRPKPEDYARAFVPGVVDAAREAYETLWSQPPRVPRMTRDCQLRCHLSPAGMLADGNVLSRHFPGGYRNIAQLLDPHRVWAAWKLIEPGHDAGMAYDGLVWLDDHWAWFPKPYRNLAHLLQPG